MGLGSPLFKNQNLSGGLQTPYITTNTKLQDWTHCGLFNSLFGHCFHFIQVNLKDQRVFEKTLKSGKNLRKKLFVQLFTPVGKLLRTLGF